MATEATLVLDIDSSGAVGAAKALAAFERQASKLAVETAKLEGTVRKADGSFERMGDIAKKNQAEITRLANSYNPLLAVQLKYAEAEKEVARAVQLGVLSKRQASEYLVGMREGMESAAASGNKFFKVFGGGVGQVQNASYQIGDFFVQIASGQNAMMAASQQLPQLLGGFGAIGAAAGAATAILGAVWMIMGNGETSAQKLTKSLERVTGAIGEMRSLSASVSFDGLDQLREKYGQVDKQVINLINNQRMYNELLASTELKNSIKTITEFADGRWYDIGISNAASSVLKLRSAFNVTKNDAEALRGAFVAVGEAKGPEQQITALERVGDYLRIVLSNSEKVTDEQLETYKAVLDATDAAKQLLAVSGRMPGAFENAARSASRITDALNAATSAAARLAAAGVSDARYAQIELDFRTDKVGRAAAIAAAKFDAEVGKAGMDQGLFNRMRNQAIEGAKEAARIMDKVERLNDADRKAESNVNKSSTAGARELKAAEKQFQSLRELLEKDSTFQVAEWEKRQAQLVAALDRGLITKQQYAEMESQLQVNYFGTEYQQRQLNYEISHQQLVEALERELITRQQYAIMAGSLHSQRVSDLGAQDANRYSNDLGNLAKHMGEMNQIAGGGYDKILKAQKVFGAASALISTYTGAAEALKLPFPYNIAAAGKIIATGMGFVNAIKGGGGGGGSARASATQTQAATQAPPNRYVNISLDGLTTRDAELIESVISEIESQSKDGRKIIFSRG